MNPQTGKRVANVTNTYPPYLKLHVEEEETPVVEAVEEIPGLHQLFETFEKVTGWTLAFHESGESFRDRVQHTNPGSAPPPRGKLVIDDMSALLPPGTHAVHRVRCEELVTAMNGLLQELEKTRHELWKREGELAAAFPLIQHQNEDGHLAKRLESSVASAALAVDASAAALYLLDESTQSLKMRSCWGLPTSRLLKPARELQNSIADLEALLGHAVVLEDTSSLRHWNPPEDYPAAACVPVSSATTPLGTLWVFNSEKRDYSEKDTNLLEVVAGRLAAELEREVALSSGAKSIKLDRQVEQGSRWLQNRLPTLKPLLDEFEVDGWTKQSGPIGGDFHYWNVLPDGRLGFGIGDVQAPTLEAGFGSAALMSMLSCHAEYQKLPGELLSRVSESLWTSSLGDQYASVGYGIADTSSKKIWLSSAGCVGSIYVAKSKVEVLTENYPSLGVDPDTFYSHSTRTMKKGDLLIMFSDGVRNRLGQLEILKDDQALAELIRSWQKGSASEVVQELVRLLGLERKPEPQFDMTLLVLKCR